MSTVDYLLVGPSRHSRHSCDDRCRAFQDHADNMESHLVGKRQGDVMHCRIGIVGHRLDVLGESVLCLRFWLIVEHQTEGTILSGQIWIDD